MCYRAQVEKTCYRKKQLVGDGIFLAIVDTISRSGYKTSLTRGRLYAGSADIYSGIQQYVA